MAEVVKRENIFVKWVLWQFWEMPKFLISVWNNYIVFATNLFSLPQLLKTLFLPWRRNAWKYPKIFDVQEYANVFISNIFSCIIGVFMRIALLIAGAFFQVFVMVVGLLAIIFWLAVPFIIILAIFLIFW